MRSLPSLESLTRMAVLGLAFAAGSMQPATALAVPPENDNCDAAPLLAPCSKGSLEGDTSEARNDYDPTSGGCTGRAAEGRDVAYAIDLMPGQTLQLTYTAVADGSMYLVFDCGEPTFSCVQGVDATGPGEPEVLTHVSAEIARCYIVLDSFGADTGGAWTLEYTVTCPQPGACCYLGGGCELQLEADCNAGGGVYLGDGVVCEPNQCPELGACCLPWGQCQILDEGTCLIWYNAPYMGDGTACDPDPCFATGACCIPDSAQGVVCNVVAAYDCAASNGSWHGVGSDCDPNPCQGTGACCLPSGECILADVPTCEEAGGIFEGATIPCDPNPCPQVPVVPDSWGGIKRRYR